jgi:tRNA 2-thiouridine synthesizing protein A
MTVANIAQRVDARGLSCPLPIVRTAMAVKAMHPGELIEVLATDPGAPKDFEAWARTTGHQLVESTVENGVYRFVLIRK